MATTLGALFRQNYPTDAYEILLADDGSTDGTKEFIENLDVPPNFKYIRQINGGPAKARNTGIRNATGEVILFIDDDVFADENLLANHYKCHSESQEDLAVLGYTPFHPEVIVSPIMRYHAERWERIFNEAKMTREKGRELLYYYLISLNVSVKKESLVKAGLFNELFTRADFEDTELGYRLCKNGVKIKFCREAFALHYYQTDLASSCRRSEKNGLQAGRLYENFPELRENFRIDYATYQTLKRDSLSRKVRTFLRKCLFTNFNLLFLKHVTRCFEQVIPFKVLNRLYSLLHLNYFSKGVRQGLKDSRKGAYE